MTKMTIDGLIEDYTRDIKGLEMGIEKDKKFNSYLHTTEKYIRLNILKRVVEDLEILKEDS